MQLIILKRVIEEALSSHGGWEVKKRTGRILVPVSSQDTPSDLTFP